MSNSSHSPSHLRILAGAIESGIRDGHCIVLNLWLDRLEQRLDNIEALAVTCSYHAGLNDYVYFKIQLHHIQNRLDDGFIEERGLFGRFSDVKTRMTAIHDKMYDNVCLECPSCKSRVNQWPKEAKFKLFSKTP